MENSSERIDRTDGDVQTTQNDVLTACSASADPSPANAPLEGNSVADAGDSEGEWKAVTLSESNNHVNMHNIWGEELAFLIYEQACADLECDDSMDEIDAQVADLMAGFDRVHAANLEMLASGARLDAEVADTLARSRRILAESAKLEAESAKVVRATRRPARPAHRKCHACKARALAARLIRK